MDVAVGVRDGYVELSVRREKGGRYHFDCVGRFAEEAELVGFLLYSNYESASLLYVAGCGVDWCIGEDSRTV